MRLFSGCTGVLPGYLFGYTSQVVWTAELGFFVGVEMERVRGAEAAGDAGAGNTEAENADELD